MYTYDTVSAALNGLKARGFKLDFNLSENCLVCNENKFGASEFEIMEVYRFEGDSDPSDEAIVYAIQSNTGFKGTLVNGYGISADTLNSEMAQKLSFHKK